MNLTFIVYLVLAAAAVIFSWSRDRGRTKRAFEISLKGFFDMLPTFLVIFGLIGILEVYLSKGLILKLLGGSVGVLGPIVGALIGSVAAGPPATAFPIGWFLLGKGASTAAVAAFIVSWVLVGVASLPAEISYFNMRFALSRNLLSFLFSIVIGIMMGWLL